MESRPAILAAIARAKAIVAAWPGWKRNLLVESANPRVRVARRPIVFTTEGVTDDTAEK